MKNFDAYLFDLDGTLVDSKLGIIESIKKALLLYGINENDEERLNSFIGPPIHVSMFNHYGFDETKAMQATNEYRRVYAEKGIYDCALYPNAESTLKALRKNKKIICLATSKPQIYAEKVLKSFGIEGYFDHIQGADMEGNFCEKVDIIGACIRALNLDKNTALMVGDRKYDVLGAKAVGIKCAGVLCGYGSAIEFKAAGADYIINDVSDLI